MWSILSTCSNASPHVTGAFLHPGAFTAHGIAWDATGGVTLEAGGAALAVVAGGIVSATLKNIQLCCLDFFLQKNK